MKRLLAFGALGVLLLSSACKKEEITGIAVTIRPQAGTNIDVNNARVQVYSDANFTNLVTEKAALGSATMASCTLEVAPGTYYVAAWKDMDNDGQLTAGDIWGFHANDLGQPLGVTVGQGELVAISFTVEIFSGGGGGGGGGGGQTGAISGTAVLAPGSQGDLRGARVAIFQSIADWNQDNVYQQQQGQGQANQISFTFSDLPPGSYVLEVWQDNGDGQWGTAGDLIGVYNDQDFTNGIQPDLINVQAGQTVNVQVLVFQIGGLMQSPGFLTKAAATK